jgi:hypothetical protein
MATTTNYSWTTPDDTALVKDGAAAIRSLGTAIDTTVFTNAGAAVAKATVDAKGDLIAGTADNTVARLAVGANGTTLVADSSTATGLVWKVDPVADLVTTAGDTLYATAADTLVRLGIGTAGQILQVNSGATAPEWVTPTSAITTGYAEVSTAQTTSSSTYTDLATSGPAVTLTTGTKVLVIVSARIWNQNDSACGFMDYAVSGATTRSASDTTALLNSRVAVATTASPRGSAASQLTVTAGSNTFTAKYRSVAVANQFADRSIFVMNLG